MVIKNNTNPTGADHAKKKPKQIFVYGNYKAYYGYRIGQNGSEDPRLSMFKKEWFEGKDCLEIGCNQGIVTIDVANKFSCRSILGRDIDGYNACWNLRKIAKQELLSTERDDKSEHHLSNFTDELSKEGAKKLKSEPSLQVEPNLLNIVSFRKENIVANTQCPSAKYDTILCLSVTKWIHLNWGDDRLITLFVKIWQMLRAGGIFILEPQRWESYKKNFRAEIRFRSVDALCEPFAWKRGQVQSPDLYFSQVTCIFMNKNA